MPKPQRLHPRGRATPASLHKPDGASADESSGDSGMTDELARSFELELFWCIQQLERVLAEKKLSEKQLQESWKVLAVLKNNNQPLIRKRQLMRTHFGDYRAKMAQEEKKLVKMANAIKMTESPTNPKATFIRRSAFLTTGDNAFRFSFELTPEQLQDPPEELQSTPEPQKSAETVDTSADNAKDFKFSFSNSPFKFNFKENAS